MHETINVQRNLEVTFRDGRPVAAYLSLPRASGDKSARTERRPGGLLIDFTADGRPIGIEITAPRRLSLEALNAALASVNSKPADAAEIEPLAA